VAKGKGNERLAPINLEKPVEVISIEDDDDNAAAKSKLSATYDCDFFFESTYEQPHPDPSKHSKKQKVRDCKACQ
jgi:hypothetical protein